MPDAKQPGTDVAIAAAMLAANLRPWRDRGTAAGRMNAAWWLHPRTSPSAESRVSSRHERPKRTLAKERPSDLELSQFYTVPLVARLMFAVFREHFNPDGFLMVEPSAGEGAFLKLLTGDRLAFDIEPKCRGIHLADFLDVEIACDQPIAMIGNPPFGRNSSLAKKFFNHSARQAMVIAMILPRTFRKASIQNALDRRFHLFRDVDVPDDAFTFRSKRQSVPAVFQIWTRGDGVRDLRQTARTHADFRFTGPDAADFAIRRIGFNAGRIYSNPIGRPSSFHFIRGDVRKVMSKIDLAGAARNVAGVPSISKGEIVELYNDWIRRHGKA